MPIKAVVFDFDVGETLINETRQWTVWADWLDVTQPYSRCLGLPRALKRFNHTGED